MCHMEMSDSIIDLVTALAKAQSEMTIVRKDATNPHFKSKYADLASVLDAVSPALTKNDIALVQPVTTGADGEAIITTMVVHKSGQFMRSSLSIVPSQKGAQAFGSAITYGRRYSLMAMLGVAPDDDDGNAASPVGSFDDAAVFAFKAPQKAVEVNHDVAAQLDAEEQRASAYVADFKSRVAKATTTDQVREMWRLEGPKRREYALTEHEIADLTACCSARTKQLTAGFLPADAS